MAVYTKISDSDAAGHLLQYDIGELQSLKGIAEGVQNSNYLLATTRGQYILTLYEQMVHEDDLPYYIGLMEHLSARGINCPKPMITKSGSALSQLCGRPAAIVSFLNGVSVSSPTSDHCAQLGGMLAKMHLAAGDFPKFLDNPLSQSRWRDFYAKSKSRAGEITAELPQAMESELDFLDKHWPDTLPKGVIHADLFPDNVFFLSNQLSGIIDFYFAANDLLAFDLAICINAWCFETNGNFNREKSLALLLGYHAIRKLNTHEIENFQVLCRGASIRFLVTRIYDWLHVPPDAIVIPHDPLIFFNRLKFHQNISGPQDYGLDQLSDARA